MAATRLPAVNLLSARLYCLASHCLLLLFTGTKVHWSCCWLRSCIAYSSATTKRSLKNLMMRHWMMMWVNWWTMVRSVVQLFKCWSTVPAVVQQVVLVKETRPNLAKHKVLEEHSGSAAFVERMVLTQNVFCSSPPQTLPDLLSSSSTLFYTRF